MSTSGPQFRARFDATRRLIVDVSGDLDMAVADRLLTVVEQQRPLSGPVLLDAERLAFVDSYGLRSLVAIRTSCLADTGAPPTLVRPSRQLRRLLELTGLTDHFVVEATSPLPTSDQCPHR